jgi:hypothetical protein
MARERSGAEWGSKGGALELRSSGAGGRYDAFIPPRLVPSIVMVVVMV